MDRRQIEHLERRLLRERDRALRSLGRFQEQSKLSRDAADNDLSSYSFHMADQGTDAMEREKAFLFASEEGRRLAAIDAALRKLYREPDTFGQCERCGGAIGFARLEALPHTTLCISCQTLQEAGGG